MSRHLVGKIVSAAALIAAMAIPAVSADPPPPALICTSGMVLPLPEALQYENQNYQGYTWYLIAVVPHGTSEQIILNPSDPNNYDGLLKGISITCLTNH